MAPFKKYFIHFFFVDKFPLGKRSVKGGQLVFLFKVRPEAIETLIAVSAQTNKITIVSARKYLGWASVKIYFKFSTPKCNQELLYQVWKCFFVYRALVPSCDTAYVQSSGWNRSRVRVQPQCKRNLQSDYGLITLTHVILITFLAQSFMDSWQSAKRDAGTEGKLRRWTRQSSSGKIMWPIRLFLLKFIPGPLLKIRQSKTRLHLA